MFVFGVKVHWKSNLGPQSTSQYFHKGFGAAAPLEAITFEDLEYLTELIEIISNRDAEPNLWIVV